MQRGRQAKRAPVCYDPASFVGDGEFADACTFITIDFSKPKTFKRAMACAELDPWIATMGKKMHSLLQHEVYALVPPPPRCYLMGSKWIVKGKTRADGSLDKLKA